MALWDLLKMRVRDALGNPLPKAKNWRFVNANASYNAEDDAIDFTLPGSEGGGSLVGSASINVTGDGTLGLGALTSADLLTAENVRLTSTANRNIYGMAASLTLGEMVPGKTVTNDNPVGGYDFVFHNESASVSGGAQNRFKLPSAEGASFTLKPGQTRYFPYNYGSTNRWVKEDEVDAFVQGELASALAARVGRRDGEERRCAGVGALGVGPGNFRWHSGDSTVADGTNVLGSSAAGRWKRVHVNVKELYVIDLFTRRGAYDGERVWCTGYYSYGNGTTGVTGLGDNGGGEFRWDGSSTLVMDGGMIVGPGHIGPDANGLGAFLPDSSPAAGRWIRIYPNTSHRNVKGFGALGWGLHNYNGGNGYIADENAIMAAHNSARPYGAEVYFPEGSYTVSRCLRLVGGSGGRSNCRWVGENRRGQTINNVKLVWYGTRYWNGPTSAGASADPALVGSVLMCMGNYDSSVENIQFGVAPGHHCEVLLNLGYHEGDAIVASVTHQRIKNCAFVGQQPALDTGVGQGSASFGVVFDYFRKQNANIENCRLSDCTFAKIRDSCILISPDCQPYNTTIEYCYFINSGMHSTDSNAGPYGIGIRNRNASCSLEVKNCDFQRIAVIFKLQNPFQSLTVTECSSEQFKKLFEGMQSTEQTMGTMAWRGGRLDPGGVDDASEGPDATFPDWDYAAIDIGASSALRLESLNLTRGFDEFTTFEIKWKANTIYVINCDLPHVAPFFPQGEVTPSVLQGGIWCEGCTAPGRTGTAQAGKRVRVPRLQGCRTPGGTVTFSDAATTVSITNRHPDGTTAWPEAVGSVGYKVRWLGAVSIAGTPASGEPYAASITKDGFTATRTVAAGVGNSVTYAYELYREGVP